MRIPFLHYTSLDNLPGILKNTRLMSRKKLVMKDFEFIDISIDPSQPVRERKGLLDYVPLFAGFYARTRSYELTGYLMEKYDDPRVYNKSFYGTLAKTLQNEMGDKYENIIILLVDDELVYKFADQGKVRFFTDIAVKPDAVELPIRNRMDLQYCLRAGIEGASISGEIDIFDDGQVSIGCTTDIEAIVVDSNKIKKRVEEVLAKHNTSDTSPLILISELPWDAPTRAMSTRIERGGVLCPVGCVCLKDCKNRGKVEDCSCPCKYGNIVKIEFCANFSRATSSKNSLQTSF